MDCVLPLKIKSSLIAAKGALSKTHFHPFSMKRFASPRHHTAGLQRTVVDDSGLLVRDLTRWKDHTVRLQGTIRRHGRNLRNGRRMHHNDSSAKSQGADDSRAGGSCVRGKFRFLRPLYRASLRRRFARALEPKSSTPGSERIHGAETTPSRPAFASLSLFFFSRIPATRLASQRSRTLRRSRATNSPPPRNFLDSRTLIYSCTSPCGGARRFVSTTSTSPKPDLGSLRIDEGKRRSGKTGKILGAGAAILGLAVIVTGGVFALRNQTPVVEVAAAQKVAAGRPTLLNASGYVTPRRRATVAAKITGRVTGVFFDEGMHVAQGYVLARLDDSDVRRALDSAIADRNATQAQIVDFQVQLKNAEIELHRAQQLQAAGVQSQETLDNASTAADSLRAKIALTKQQVLASEARIQEAQQAVDNCVIRAPFDGIIVSKDAQVGEMVSPISAGGGFTRTGIATIVDMNSNEIEVDVNEAYIARVLPDQPVTAILDASPDWQIPSKVRTVIPTADRQKATVKVRISFLKLDPRILPDMGVKVTFLGDEQVEKKGAVALAALIPPDAVRTEDGAKAVYLVIGDQLARAMVKLGVLQGNDLGP